MALRRLWVQVPSGPHTREGWQNGNALVSKTSGVNPLAGSSPAPSAKRMINFFKRTKKEPKSLKEVLAQFKDLKEDFGKLSEELKSLRGDHKFSVQKVGVVRFNPFSDVGGDQSFSLALLDGNNNGVVITSLYSRGENRVYGKPIKEGQSEYSLSIEEKEAINKALETKDEK
jgi:hypothetical protein